MRYSNDDVNYMFTRWCKAVKVKQAKPRPPIIDGSYSKPYEFIVGTYTIPDGIMGYGIAKYVNDGGAINVIMRTESRTEFVERMLFAVNSIEIKKHK